MRDRVWITGIEGRDTFFELKFLILGRNEHVVETEIAQHKCQYQSLEYKRVSMLADYHGIL